MFDSAVCWVELPEVTVEALIVTCGDPPPPITVVLELPVVVVVMVPEPADPGSPGSPPPLLA
ncbi:hypothetical protein A5790_17965 [Mycobacterium sp. 852002-51152_SCH6134967]|nr:hypothetical protein A5790_17965 [Mycobacterium sp. 852002-51152_SCH6134967]